ncbi:MAG: site-specific integrase [Verrucomicrobia bacterium]|nr:site-specific integrase [Verrucomicrobiota bacterium]
MQLLRDNPPSHRKRDEHLSANGKWRSFPKVPHLLQYVISGNYFGKVKINGKTIRKSLETSVWTTAQLRLNDFLKEHRENRNKVDAPTIKEAVELYKTELASDSTIKASSKGYRHDCIVKLERTWPELWDLRLDEITRQACKDWAAKLVKEIACQYFNNVIGTLRLVIASGIKSHKEKTGVKLENPATELKRVRIRQKELQLPESSHFKSLVENLRMRSGGWGPRVADLVEFLAYSGLRIRSEALWVTWDDIDWKRREIIVRGDPVTATKNSETRRVPLIPDMEGLLVRLRDRLGTVGNERILQVNRGHESLARACKEIGIPRLTHHDFRHLFATRCIESGVDIPTVSRWLGHKDGGALAMKTYGHLRNEHSQAMAQRVKF